MPVSWLSDIADTIIGQSPPGDTCNNSGSGMPLLNGRQSLGLITLRLYSSPLIHENVRCKETYSFACGAPWEE